MSRQILLIDDDLDMHDVVRLILEPTGCTVTCCSTAPAGWALLRQGLPDLILLDIMLASPHEGLRIARELKGDPRTRPVPIIMISSIGESIGQEYAREIGAATLPGDAFLEKPLDPQALRITVARLLDSSAA